MRQLDAIDAKMASTQPTPGQKSIAAHIDHVETGLAMLNRWAAGEANPWASADPNASWQRTAVTEEQWRALRDRRRHEADQWQKVVATRTSWDDMNAAVALSTAAHTAYHLGAIRQILAALHSPGDDSNVAVKPATVLRGRELMKKTANAQFAITNWDEKPYSEVPNQPKLTRASVTKTFTGDIEGDSQVEYVMMYRSDGTAAFVGLERIVGKIGGKAGSFVLQRTGKFENGQAIETYSVIPGSGTGELITLGGDGSSSVGHGLEHPFVLNYELS